MQIPVQITFRDVPPSEAVEAHIREKVAKLEKFFDHLMACRVVVEAPHRHHHKGRLYHVRIDLTIPGGELVVSRAHNDEHAHEDVYVAIRDAFDAARRQLQDHVRRRRGEVKVHEGPPHGRIARLVPAQDYGIIEDASGREIYFHRNSVIDEDFEHLEVGMEVWWSEEMGEKGPKATTVHVAHRHHAAG